MSRDSIETARAEAEAHRDGLVNALSSLLSSRYPDELGKAATGQVADTARVVAHQGIKAARANPASLVLIGAGLAMLAVPSKQKSAAQPATSAQQPLSADVDARIAKADARHMQQARIQADRVDIGPGRAQALRVKLDEGLGKLGPEARARVRAARLKAVSAQEQLEQRASKLGNSLRESHETRPLMSLVASAGIGALIGALLPSTQRETETLGAKRDQLLRDAEAVLRDEIAQLEERGKAVVDAGMTAARNEMSDTLGGASEKASVHG